MRPAREAVCTLVLRDVGMRQTFSDRLFSVAVLLPFGAVIAYLHYWKGVAFSSFIYGSGSWGFGCILKLVLYHGVIHKLRHDSNTILRVSALNGLVSGVTEPHLAGLIYASAAAAPARARVRQR
jgi:hypothetical protein